ncbi:MAG: hypothetical protein FWD47_14730 [Treponema sp.]|nr:hypothetical protein [Treponema sp.]
MSDKFKALMSKGTDHMMHFDFDEALEVLLEAVELTETQEEKGECIYNIGRVHERRGDKETSIDCMNMAADCGNQKAIKFLKEKFDIDYTPEAPESSSISSEAAEGSQAVTERSHWWYMDVAFELINDEDYDTAIDCLTDAIFISKTDEEFADAYSMRAFVYVKKGEHDRCIADHKTAANYKDKDALEALQKMGISYTPQKPSSPIKKNDKITYDNGVYEGDTFEGKHHGKGKFTGTNGKSFEGEWKYGKQHGKGIYKDANEEYDGDWVDGKSHGKGKRSDNDGVYEGDFENGSKHGNGKFIWKNGDVYEGDWNDGERTGKGKYTWPNGTIYEGDWVENKRIGMGKTTYPGGKIEEGRYENNRLVEAIASSPAKKFCGKCGNKLNEGAKFCGGCGEKIG